MPTFDVSGHERPQVLGASHDIDVQGCAIPHVQQTTRRIEGRGHCAWKRQAVGRAQCGGVKVFEHRRHSGGIDAQAHPPRTVPLLRPSISPGSCGYPFGANGRSRDGSQYDKYTSHAASIVQIFDIISTFITRMSDDAFFSLANIHRTAASRRRKRCNYDKTFTLGIRRIHVFVLRQRRRQLDGIGASRPSAFGGGAVLRSRPQQGVRRPRIAGSDHLRRQTSLRAAS